MRTYYIFMINEHFSHFYRKKPYTIYKTLETIYKMKEYDIVLGYKLYNEVAIPFNKRKVNEYIVNSYDGSFFYYKSANHHLVESGINFEKTKLLVGNANLKIKTTVNYSLLFDILKKYDDKIFVCDFVNKDYFWLSNITKNDCQKKETLVQ